MANTNVYAFGDAVLFAGLTPGARYYLDGATPGAITTTAPTNAVFLGLAKGATELLIDVDAVGGVTGSLIQSQTYTAFTTAGATGAFTLTPSPSITAYNANQRYRIKFHASGNGTDTINISGLGAKNLKQYDSSGAKVAPIITTGLLTDVEYDGTDCVILNPLPTGSITGKEYNDVTASRALATTFTNALDVPIHVSIDATMPSTAQLIGKVGGVAIAWSNSQQSGNDTGLQFTVGAKKSYRIDASAGTPTLIKWFEGK